MTWRQIINQLTAGKVSMKDLKKQKHNKDSKNRQVEKSEMQELSEQNMENVEEHAGASTEPMDSRMSGRERYSSNNLTIKVELSEEHSNSFPQFYNGVRAPVRQDSSSQDESFGDLSQRKFFPSKIHARSKKIVKEKKIKDVKQTTTTAIAETTTERRRSRQRSVSRDDPVRERKRENHRKYTVKSVSNFPRKELKRLGFNFSQLEAKDNNKRGSRIYLNVALLELKHLLGNGFSEFINSYIRYCDRRISEHLAQQHAHGWTERNERYIEDFNKAKNSATVFLGGDYIGSIKLFFGVGKEVFYLEQSIQYFTQRERDLEEKHLFDVLL